MSWVLIVIIAIGCYFFRSLGVIAGSGNKVPDRLAALLPWLAPAFIGGVITVTALVDDGMARVEIGVFGVLVALIAAVLRAPFLVILVAGLGTTILLRFLTH